jgi:hypothetical protein
MTPTALQSLCETGQRQLMLMDYLAAEATLVQAERAALELSDFETLSRLYMPLQEARRQRRQRCGEGIVHLHLVAKGPDDAAIDPARLIEQYPHGQLLIAGWGTIEPAIHFRELADQRRLYVETYLAAVYPIDDGPAAVVIVPTSQSPLPAPTRRPLDSLRAMLPPHSLVLRENELPAPQPGDFKTYAFTMSVWEQLHGPFLAAADAQRDPLQKMDGYRAAIAVDYACELAHQRLSDTARAYARSIRNRAAV